jgi:hypothetical protein
VKIFFNAPVFFPKFFRTFAFYRAMGKDIAYHHCTACDRPFVIPDALLEVVDEGLYLIALDCKNCGRMTLATVEDADLEAYERELDRLTEHLMRVADVFGPAELVLPEDL